MDQVAVDGAIAQIVENEQNLTSSPHDTNNASVPINVTVDTQDISCETTGEQDDPDEQDPTDTYNADTEVEDSENEQQKKGYGKLTMHGIKKKSASEGRSYRCTVCRKTKRSAQ